ncbi:hypothetical protein SAMN04487972_11011 [Paracoccus halophilus]|uniref:Uncharacterized protein n=1 Tax=Paracoccus halophilus TaxID=376733 RepID=A0A1I0TLT6_9RHOB|nr:hypothetical protein [Paracoccus halophilus]SFA52705.1 hypothetical protein SAMN04487972_11011 [Paracoccus halophilus]
MARTTKAAVVREFGKPLVIEEAQASFPRSGRGAAMSGRATGAGCPGCTAPAAIAGTASAAGKRQVYTAFMVNGGFADYLLADSDYVAHLPQNIGFAEVAPIICAGRCNLARRLGVAVAVMRWTRTRSPQDRWRGAGRAGDRPA